MIRFLIKKTKNHSNRTLNPSHAKLQLSLFYDAKKCLEQVYFNLLTRFQLEEEDVELTNLIYRNNTMDKYSNKSYFIFSLDSKNKKRVVYLQQIFLLFSDPCCSLFCSIKIVFLLKCD